MIAQEESFLPPKTLLAISMSDMSLNSHWLLWRPHCMKVPRPLLSLLRRLMEPSLVSLRAIGLLLTSDCAEEEELLRLRLRGLDIVEDGWCFVCKIVDADADDLKCDVICSIG
jgi:hypothetical protein